MQPSIEGASLEQRRLLDDILAHFGSSRIARVEIRPYQATSEEGDLPLPGDHGDEIFVAGQPDDPRGRWEGELLSVAFARRSKAAGLRKVVWYAYSDGGMTLEHAWPPLEGLAANELDRFAAEVAAAAGDARWFRGGGFSRTRHDVQCCAPFLGMSQPIDWQGPPPCPVLDQS